MNNETEELQKESEFLYEEWYKEQAFKLAELLMKVLFIANSINEGDSLWGPIKNKIKKLRLADQYCKRCSARMSYWDWAIRGKYCDKCISELEQNQ